MNIIGRGKWEALQKGRKEIADLIEKQVKEHLETYDESHARDYIDVYIQQTKKCDPNSSFYGKEGSKYLKKIFSKRIKKSIPLQKLIFLAISDKFGSHDARPIPCWSRNNEHNIAMGRSTPLQRSKNPGQTICRD